MALLHLARRLAPAGVGVRRRDRRQRQYFDASWQSQLRGIRPTTGAQCILAESIARSWDQRAYTSRTF